MPLSMAGAGSSSNTVSPGMRPASLSSGILIHPTVWPQYRQDRHTGHPVASGESFTKTVAQKWFAVWYRANVPSVCPGWIKTPLGTEVGLYPGNIVLDWDPAPHRKGRSSPPSPATFWPTLIWHGRPAQQLLIDELLLKTL